jgi:hypothetical protein
VLRSIGAFIEKCFAAARYDRVVGSADFEHYDFAVKIAIGIGLLLRPLLAV